MILTRKNINSIHKVATITKYEFVGLSVQKSIATVVYINFAISLSSRKNASV